MKDSDLLPVKIRRITHRNLRIENAMSGLDMPLYKFADRIVEIGLKTFKEDNFVLSNDTK